MTLRHAAALALVGFWLLMKPPTHKGNVDIKAPQKKWMVTGYVFDSSANCQAWRDRQLESMRKNYGKILTKVPNALSQVDELVTQYEASMCVSSDDPRLKSN